jgi:hypothetical protein
VPDLFLAPYKPETIILDEFIVEKEHSWVDGWSLISLHDRASRYGRMIRSTRQRRA